MAKVETLMDHFEPVVALDDPLRLTNSGMKEFMEDKRKWMLNSIFGFKKKDEAPVGPLALGSRVHSALEYLYTHGDGLLTEYSRLAEVDRELFMESPDGFWTEKVEAFNSEAELGRIMLEGYQEWAEEEGLDADITVEAVEKSVSAPIKDGRVMLMSKQDLTIIDHMDDARVIRDFKTAQNMSDYDKIASIDSQLPFYQYVESLADPSVRLDGGQFVVLRKVKRSARSKPPFYQVWRTRTNEHALESISLKVDGLADEMLDTRDRILRGEDHRRVAPSNPTRDTSWKNPYYNLYPLMDDGSDYIRMLENEFVQSNPLARYGDPEES